MEEDILLKQKAFFDAGNTVDTRSRRAMLQILANTVKDLQGENPETEGLLSCISDIRKNLYKWTGTGTLRMMLSLFAKPSKYGPAPLGATLIDASAADSLEAVLTPLICALAAGNTAVVLTPDSEIGEAVRRIVDETFTDDYVAAVKAGSEEAGALEPQDFDFVHACSSALSSALEGFCSFSKMPED